MSIQGAEVYTILVPLDGSELAERALPIAFRLAAATHSKLLLVRVVPATTWAFAVPGGLATPAVYQQIMDDEQRVARDYLASVADRAHREGIATDTLVVTGEPASTLIDLEPSAQVKMVVMASHGRTGLARFALGSVADRVTRAGHTPVMIVRPFDEESRQARLEHALVPVDGSPLAESALSPLDQLAGSVVRSVTLMRVVDPDAPTGETAAAQQYLEQLRATLAQRLTGRECILDSVVVHGNAAEQIIERSEHASDLVIMATHGRTGAPRWAFGSVADRVLQGIQKPLLLVRAPTQPA